MGNATKQRLSHFFILFHYTNCTQNKTMKIPYSIPKLCKAPKGWYLHFRYDGKQIRRSLNLNQIEDLDERESEYKLVCKAYHEKLKEGWNPNIAEVKEVPKMNLIQAIDFSLEKKKAKNSKKTYSGYASTISFVKEAIKKLNFESLEITAVKRIHIKQIVEQIAKGKSNHAHNKYLDHLGAILSELVDWDIIDFNPAHKIKRLPTEESILHLPADDKQMQIIKKELTQNHYNFYVYISLINYWGIRPAEILNIKLGMIDMEKEIITLNPKSTKGKKKYRVLPIIKYIKSDFEKMDFRELPKDYYLFGSFREPGKGNLGKFNDFIPAPTKMKTDTATKRWNKIVKKGLGINVTMYSMKKYGANKKAEAGISIDAIQNTFGHSKKEMTSIYITKQQEISRKEIIDKSPEL